MHYRRIMPTLLVFFLTLGACAGIYNKPRNKIEFYTLEYEPPVEKTCQPIPVIIKVKPLSVAPEYNTDEIIYRDLSFRRNAYIYHKWRANPGDLVTHFLTRDIVRSGAFEGVLGYDSSFTASYVLEGSLNEFLEWDLENRWEAVLSLDIILMRENEPDISKLIIFQKTYYSRVPCRMKNPRSLAEAMSRALEQVSKKIIGDIHETLHTD